MVIVLIRDCLLCVCVVCCFAGCGLRYLMLLCVFMLFGAKSLYKGLDLFVWVLYFC